MFEKNYSYLSADAELPPFKPVLDVQEHLWLRKQSENRRIKFDRQRLAQQNRIFQRELDFRLMKLQREIRSIKSLQQIFPLLKQSQASTQRLERSITSYDNSINNQSRPNSSKIVQEITKSKSLIQLRTNFIRKHYCN